MLLIPQTGWLNVFVLDLLTSSVRFQKLSKTSYKVLLLPLIGFSVETFPASCWCYQGVMSLLFVGLKDWQDRREEFCKRLQKRRQLILRPSRPLNWDNLHDSQITQTKKSRQMFRQIHFLQCSSALLLLICSFIYLFFLHETLEARTINLWL